MQIDVWKINGKVFHFGEHGLDQEVTLAVFPSDSLYAALIARLAELKGAEAVADFIQPFKDGKPPFLLTSTFPYAGDVLFFPMLIPLKVDEQALKKQDMSFKDIKKLGYVSKEIFEALQQGKPIHEVLHKKNTLQGKKVLISQSREEIDGLPEDMKKWFEIPENKRQETPSPSLWKIEKRPRVTLDRVSNKSQIYHTGQVYFAKDCGLWFGVYWLDETYREQTETLFYELGDAGLGGERSVGLGKSKFEKAKVQVDLPIGTNGVWTNLSRFIPSQEDISALLAEHSRYTIRRVGGWVTSPTGLGQRRKTVNLITEGAILAQTANPYPGMVADVSPNYNSQGNPLGHPVYRVGYAFPVALNGGAA